MCAPQKLNIQEFFNSGGIEAILYNPVIQKKILEHDLNPCTGEPPKTCTCNDGKMFPFSIEYRTDPCTSPAKLESCTCPDNSTFKIKDLIRDIIKKYDLPNCGEGVEPEFCSCNDGKKFDPKTVRGPPCSGNGFNAVPKSCTCPNGKEIGTNEFIAKAIPAILDLLA